MFLFEKKKCLFCVADPDFINNSKFQITWVDYDENYVKNLMNAAEIFWRENIFMNLFNSLKK